MIWSDRSQRASKEFLLELFSGRFLVTKAKVQCILQLVEFTRVDLQVTFVFALVLRNVKRIIFIKVSFKGFDLVA